MIDNDTAAAPTAIPAQLALTFRPADRYGFLSRKGVRLRYACWNVQRTAGPRSVQGSVVLQQGRGEFIEKYATEVVGELLDRGFCVFALDWRGQGLSDRVLADRDKGHIDSFSTYLGDFQLFLERVVAPAAPQPVLAVGHSTGGHLLLRYLAESGRGPFAAALCASPMTGLCRELAIRTLVTLVSPRGGSDTSYMVSTGPYDARQRTFANNDVTSDERRFRFTDQWFKADRRLTLGGPTVGWLKQALRSIDGLFAPGRLEGIDLPVAVVSAGADRVVDVRSHEKAVRRIRGAELISVQGAQHEIMMERDSLRAQFWRAFDRLARQVVQ
jgi:lysophospholipase